MLLASRIPRPSRKVCHWLNTPGYSILSLIGLAKLQELQKHTFWCFLKGFQTGWFGRQNRGRQNRRVCFMERGPILRRFPKTRKSIDHRRTRRGRRLVTRQLGNQARRRTRAARFEVSGEVPDGFKLQHRAAWFIRGLSGSQMSRNGANPQSAKPNVQGCAAKRGKKKHRWLLMGPISGETGANPVAIDRRCGPARAGDPDHEVKSRPARENE